MSIQDTIDELKRVGEIHGFHQPVAVKIVVEFEDEDGEGTKIETVEATAVTVQWIGGEAVIEPLGTVTIETGS